MGQISVKTCAPNGSDLGANQQSWRLRLAFHQSSAAPDLELSVWGEISPRDRALSGSKLEAAKLASLGLLDRLTSRDRLTVVSFASEMVAHLQAVAMDDVGKRQARSAIGELGTRGMTNLSGGWFAAVDPAAEAAEKDMQF